MTELETSLIALLEEADKTQTAQNNELQALGAELEQVNIELNIREKESKALQESLTRLHSLVEQSLTLQETQQKQLQHLESVLQNG